jgi:hypothetical protein
MFSNNLGFKRGGNCSCNLSQLTILILIVLQFSKKKECTDNDEDGQLVDDGILFIITIFYLCCANPCKQQSVC